MVKIIGKQTKYEGPILSRHMESDEFDKIMLMLKLSLLFVLKSTTVEFNY